MREYYNSLEFSKANDIKWVNPELSLKLFNVYLNKTGRIPQLLLNKLGMNSAYFY